MLCRDGDEWVLYETARGIDRDPADTPTAHAQCLMAKSQPDDGLVIFVRVTGSAAVSLLP